MRRVRKGFMLVVGFQCLFIVVLYTIYNDEPEANAGKRVSTPVDILNKFSFKSPSKTTFKKEYSTTTEDQIVKKVSALVDIPTNFNFTGPSKKTFKKQHKVVWFNTPSWIPKHHKIEFMHTCEYSNCHVTFDKKEINSSSAIIFCPINPGMGFQPPISSNSRNPDQVWISYSIEPPMNFYFSDYKSQAWTNTINWTMTYRFDADILAPYGNIKSRKVPPERDYNEIFNRKSKQVAWIVSHCNAASKRDEYVAELQKFGVEVDIYGGCGKQIARQDNTDVDKLINTYKFFISFENALCKDYISDKVFNKYSLDVILIVRGGGDYDKLLPVDTYINTAKFTNISRLAEYINDLSSDKAKYIDLLRKKDRYESLNEDEFGYRYAMCEMCRKLNQLDQNRNTYRLVGDFLQANSQCRYAHDVPGYVPPIASGLYY